MSTFDLKIDDFAKIEGKASLTVHIQDDKIENLQFAITEFKRFYTQALRGKDIMGLPQLCCRICGTCSNAHLLCAIKASEQALGISPTVQTILLRKLLNYGLIIRDHALHCYVFSLPDVLGIDNILELDENIPEQRQILEDTFAVKAVGNNLGKLIGGKSVHAPYPTIGGFVRFPDVKEFPAMIEQLKSIRPAVMRLITQFEHHSFSLLRDSDHMTLMNNDYSFLDGSILRTGGEEINDQDYGNFLEHIVIPYSHSSGYSFKGTIHMTGALARLNLAKEKLHPNTKKDAASALNLFPSKNIFHNNLAQAIEILHAIDSSVEILQSLQITPEKPIPIVKKAGIGIGVIEAPRGLLFYKLVLNEKGTIEDIQIVVPTGQNQIDIEKSIFQYLTENMQKDKEILKAEIEKIVRSYDPCMSCASHFLKIKWNEV